MIEVELDTENMNANNSNNALEINNSFYEKYNPQIRSIVARILNNAGQPQDIGDCVNDVYLSLMEKLQQYNETRGSITAFVTIITRSTALDYCRGNRRRPGELIGDENLDFLSEPVGFEDKVEFEMLVENILANLKKDERVLFTMRYILYYSPDEIAQALKIRRSAVDMRISRLKGKVKKLLIKGGIIL